MKLKAWTVMFTVLWLISFCFFSCSKGVSIYESPDFALVDSSKLTLEQKNVTILKDSVISSLSANYRNFYGIGWRGTCHDNLAYAKQMKYDYVLYQKGMELDQLSNGLFFYLESPEYSIYNRNFDATKAYTAQQKQFFETHYALKSSTKTFPENLATGWYFSSTSFTPLLDFQQQNVINWAIDSIMKVVKKIESKNPNFHFGGFAWDVPQPTGDFWSGSQGIGKQVTLAYWTGGDFGIKYPSVIHNYMTYSDGRIQFYKQLMKKARTLYPNAKFMMEPARVYEDWIMQIQGRVRCSSYPGHKTCLN